MSKSLGADMPFLPEECESAATVESRLTIRSCNDGASVNAEGGGSRVGIPGELMSTTAKASQWSYDCPRRDRGSAFTEAGSHRLHYEASAGKLG
jgi:hypothetical protein